MPSSTSEELLDHACMLGSSSVADKFSASVDGLYCYVQSSRHLDDCLQSVRSSEDCGFCCPSRRTNNMCFGFSFQGFIHSETHADQMCCEFITDHSCLFVALAANHV
jgi:hypothetical protein